MVIVYGQFQVLGGAAGEKQMAVSMVIIAIMYPIIIGTEPASSGSECLGNQRHVAIVGCQCPVSRRWDAKMSHRCCKGQRIDSSSGWKFQMAPMAQPSQPWLLFGRHTSICCASQHGKQDISRSSEEVTRAPIHSTSHEVTRAPIRSTSHEFCKWAAIVP